MEFLIYLEILLAILRLISSLIVLFDDINRTRDMKEVSEELDWAFYPKGATSQLNNLLHFYLFSFGGSKQIRNLIYSKSEEINVAIFDYRFKLNGKKGVKKTVIYFRSPLLNLPNFNLLRKPHLKTNTFSDREVVFSSNPVFFEKYSLLTDDEAAVRRIFSDRVLAYLEQKRTLNIEAAKDRLIIYCSDGVVNSERIEAFLEEGHRVFELFREIQPQKSEPRNISLEKNQI